MNSKLLIFMLECRMEADIGFVRGAHMQSSLLPFKLNEKLQRCSRRNKEKSWWTYEICKAVVGCVGE